MWPLKSWGRRVQTFSWVVGARSNSRERFAIGLHHPWAERQLNHQRVKPLGLLALIGSHCWSSCWSLWFSSATHLRILSPTITAVGKLQLLAEHLPFLKCNCFRCQEYVYEISKFKGRHEMENSGVNYYEVYFFLAVQFV